MDVNGQVYADLLGDAPEEDRERYLKAEIDRLEAERNVALAGLVPTSKQLLEDDTPAFSQDAIDALNILRRATGESEL